MWLVMEAYNKRHMTLLAAQPEALNMINLLQLLATIGLAIIGSYFAFFKRGEQSKDKINDQKFVILEQKMDGKLGKEKGSREKERIEMLSQIKTQNSINKQLKEAFIDLKDLVKTIHESQSEEKNWYIRWSDKVNDSIIGVKDELSTFKDEIRTEADNVRKMVEKSRDVVKTNTETIQNKSEKTA